ncbi:membrane protein [Salinifilum aidingensis]
MLGWLLTTAGTAALGSVFPLVNIELYLVGVLSTVDGVSWWPLALAAAVGQVAGKSLLYFAGRGSVTLGTRLSRRVQRRRRGRWSAWFDWFQQRTRQQPWWGTGVLMISAVPGLPPYSVMCLLSGAARLPLVAFLGASLLGRSGHFLLVAAAPEVFSELPVFG